jgi:hypothetical protein
LLKILVKAHLYLSGILPLDGAHLDRSVESDDLDLDPLSAIRVAECPWKAAGALDWLPGAAGASPAAGRMTTGGSSDRRFSTTQLRAGNGSSCPKTGLGVGTQYWPNSVIIGHSKLLRPLDAASA